MFTGKTLLITGGTGSFGHAVTKRFLKTDIGQIRIFSRDEKKQEDMRLTLSDSRLKFHIGDVRDLSSVSEAMHGVDFVFHAAALKQVPSCEFYPMEAVKTNVIGTENVINTAIRFAVNRVVVLSTDKAVYPINAMGLTKSLAEKVTIAKSRMSEDIIDTTLCCTRYGNVMGSRGSVIPLFVEQLLSNKPMTVTDPQMTRFLMSLDESIDLVLTAFEQGQQGDIFIQKSPATNIENLTKALSLLFEKPFKTSVIGTRHGEKQYETLINREEMARAEDLGDYFRIPADDRDLNYSKYFDEGEMGLTSAKDYTSDNTRQLDVNELMSLVREQPFIQDVMP